MMHTELHCDTLERLDRVKAIRAIHEASLLLDALALWCDVAPYDLTGARQSLAECLRDASHAGYPQLEQTGEKP